MAEELKLDVKDFDLMTEIHDEDRFMMTQAANAHFAAAMPFKTFKEKVLQPIIESSRPNGMGCEIFTSIDEYNALVELDPKTMYVIIEEGQITQAFLGEYPFAVGGGGGGESGVPIEQVFVDLEALVLELGENRQLTASYEPADATNTTLSWTTSNRLVATVSNGLVTSVGKGECIIKVRARSGAFAECAVTVEITLIGLSFSSENNKLVDGYTTQLEPITVPENASLDLTYSSSNTAIATVDQNGAVMPVTNAGNVTITAVNKNGVRASIDMTVVPFAVSVACQGIDKTDNSVSSIFSTWRLLKKGAPTHYKYTETIKENGTESTLQSVDWTPMPADGMVDIELYAEFGYKYINWSFKNIDDSFQEEVIVPVFYKEPQLITYNFDIDVQCTAEQAQAMSMEIPYYKYDKKFVYCLRNDDNLQSLWRNGFRYVNREWNGRIRKFVPHTDDEIRNLDIADKLKAPRRLGYTNGCGVLIPFSFDCAGQVQDSNHVLTWSDESTWNAVKAADIQKHKDYGGHFLLHNMSFFADDPVKPKFENDYSYPLQRDRQIIFDNFGYTSVSYANPDGDWWYTRPCIKDPKTLLLSGNSKALSVDPNDVYGKPAHRKSYSWDSDLSNLPLSEVRNTLLVGYMFSNNAPFTVNLWKTQYQMALSGNPTLATELTHGLDHEDNSNNPGQLKKNLEFFDEIFDTVGANGEDCIWICSMDEAIEYMYYQRATKITKTITPSGCKFNIKIDIPDYLSFKTYSVKILNLPESAVVTRGQGVTMFHKNMKTGLINFGYSTDTTERASRYVQRYLNEPTNDNLDLAWHFVKQLGELQTPYASQLPALNEKPVLASVSMPDSLTNNKVVITTTNSNKEFGEANFLEMSTNEEFSDLKSYKIPWQGGHKYYDPVDSTCKNNDWNIELPFLFNQQQTLYFRLRNVYGTSNVKSITATINRVEGVNDPVIELIPNLQFKYEESVECEIRYANINEYCYKLDNGDYSAWGPLVSTLNIPMSVGNHTVIIQGRNNLNEIVEQTIDINFTGKQRIILLANVTTAGVIEGIGFVNKVSKSNTKTDNIYDIDGNIIGKQLGQYYPYFKDQIDLFRNKYGITGEKYIAEAYWEIPDLTEDNGKYPNILITNGGKKEISMYGGIQLDSTYQAVKYFTDMPIGNYKVKMLLSAKANVSYKYPNIIRVQDQTISIPVEDSAKVINNNQYWYEFDNVVVGNDGMLLVSQYTDVMFTGGLDRLSPIVLLEITKI